MHSMKQSGADRTRKKEMAVSGLRIRSIGKSRAQARTYTTVSTAERVGAGALKDREHSEWGRYLKHTRNSHTRYYTKK